MTYSRGIHDQTYTKLLQQRTAVHWRKGEKKILLGLSSKRCCRKYDFLLPAVFKPPLLYSLFLSGLFSYSVVPALVAASLWRWREEPLRGHTTPLHRSTNFLIISTLLLHHSHDPSHDSHDKLKRHPFFSPFALTKIWLKLYSSAGPTAFVQATLPIRGRTPNISRLYNAIHLNSKRYLLLAF